LSMILSENRFPLNPEGLRLRITLQSKEKTWLARSGF
jgi:hypothetical protein